MIEYFSTGSVKLDSMLDGGVATGHITQFYGGPGSSKTEVCCNLSALAASKCKILIIRTGTKFRLDRIRVIAEARHLDTEMIMHNILTAKASDTNDLERLIKSAQSEIMSDGTIKLLIIDSIIDLYRADESNHGQNNIPIRQHKLSRIMYTLSNIAEVINVAVVLTNQVFSGVMLNGSAVPTGGSIISLLCTYIVYLKKKLTRGNCIISAIRMKDPLGSKSSINFMITNIGISDTLA